VNDVLLEEVVVGPVTVLVADPDPDPEVDAVVTVPLLDAVEPPDGERVDVENPELGEEVMLADEVVVEQVVVVVEAAPDEEEVVVGAEPEEVVETEVVELAAELAEDGVQFGRVKVPL
jgi:hypothetical protein